jgi:uncharacterized protein (DUF362 family)
MKLNTDLNVSINHVGSQYPKSFPYNPSAKYPEYIGKIENSDKNNIYEGVRNSFIQLGYDKANFGSKEWNPLGHIIKPGDRVFIKPNLVTHKYGRQNSSKHGNIYSVITHPSVVRAVSDYVAIALKGKGEVTIGDNPHIDTNFIKLNKVTRLGNLCSVLSDLWHISFSFKDLREMWCDDLKNYGIKSKMKLLPGDPQGSTTINLKKRSFFYGINSTLFRGVFQDRIETIKHHHKDIQEYNISNSIYNCDVYISIPKLKAHHKVGATLNIKGLVGTCGNKNYLVHWRIGFPIFGGDEYKPHNSLRELVLISLRHFITSIIPERHHYSSWFKKLNIKKYSGSWSGNDTCWRMAADLYLALMTKKRKTFSVIDGVIGGEGNGPFTPNLKKSGVIITGTNLIAVDTVATRLINYNISKIKYLPALLKKFSISIKNIKLNTDDPKIKNIFYDKKNKYLNFAPPSDWSDLTMVNSNYEQKNKNYANKK